ncbi:hypothetical protein [Arcticibacterium luteifluviistationis]|uniref:Uncharacterized protein n=1 Tax=Arcticibacterium luteifluviistationis TaxID=1784714 RepID=A0A2Z4GGJ6_9BACT|nr:hypothetical protein [Arcticibacterium luteifluviistationis]AWW00520.1 hypothetical protein DJ013_20975 [Arcticibacterium luteifluviistationis]
MRTMNSGHLVLQASKELNAYENMLLKAQKEMSQFLTTVNHLKTKTIGDSKKALLVAEFSQDSNIIKTIISRLLEELNILFKPQNSRSKKVVLANANSIQNHQYFKNEMAYFRANYKEYKGTLAIFASEFENKYDQCHKCLRSTSCFLKTCGSSFTSDN